MQPDGQRERLVRLLAAEGDELLRGRRARSTSPYVTFPIETSATSGAPSELGIPIASGFVPASGGPPSGWPSRGGEVAVSAATSPSSASFRTQ